MRICALALVAHWRWYPVLFCICQSLSWRDLINIWLRSVSSINRVSNYHINCLSLSWQQQLRTYVMAGTCKLEHRRDKDANKAIRMDWSYNLWICSVFHSPNLPWVTYFWYVKCKCTIKQGEHCTLEWQHIVLLEHCCMTIVTHDVSCPYVKKAV